MYTVNIHYFPPAALESISRPSGLQRNASTIVSNSDTVKSGIHLDQLKNFHILRNLCTMHTSKFSVFFNAYSRVL
jgi:hypothetical protein